MEMPSHQQTLLLLDAISESAKKKEKLLQANKAAARALLASISSVSYVTQKKKESNESFE